MRDQALQKRIGTKIPKIVIEVLCDRHQEPRRDGLVMRPVGEREPRIKAGAIIVARDVETLQSVRQKQGAEVRGG